MKTSKIVKVTGSKQWKDIFYTSVELENGDKGSIGSKSEGKYKVGDEIKYEITTRESNGNTYYDIKIVKDKPEFQKGGFQKDNEFHLVSFSYAYAKDLVVADKASIDKLQDLADRIADRMMAKYKSLKGDAGTNY